MQNYQILVCEDEVEIGNAIEIYLKNQGYGVHRAYGRADDDHDAAAEL